MALVLSIEKIEITLSSTQTTNTGSTTKGQVATNCIPFTTIAHTRNTSERFNATTIRTTISGTTVTIVREVTVGSQVLEAVVYVVEFNPDVSTVQTGLLNCPNNSTTVAPTTLTDITKSFLWFNYTCTHGTDDFADTMVKGEITSTTLLTFESFLSVGDRDVQWYILECDNTEFDVQHITWTLATLQTTTSSSAFTAVDMARTMVIGSYESGETSDDPRDGSCMIDLDTTTTVRATRANGGTGAGVTIQCKAQIIQFNADEVDGVDRGIFTITGTEDTDTIGSVDLTRTMAKSQDPCGSTSMNSTNGDDIGQRNARMDLSDSTTVRGRVVTDSTTGLYTWEVVEFVISALEGIKRYIASPNVSLRI